MTIDIHINRRKNRRRQHQKQLAARPITYLEGVAWIPLQNDEHALVTDTPHNRTLIEGRLWSLHPRGYVVSRVNDKLEYLHRVLVPGVKMLDHRNGVKTDCRAENLRVCSPSQNACNRPAQKGRRLKGAYLTSTGRYTASIGHNRRNIHLGTFDTEEQAAMAYDAAALKLHGEFAMINYPEAATCH